MNITSTVLQTVRHNHIIFNYSVHISKKCVYVDNFTLLKLHYLFILKQKAMALFLYI